MVINQLLTGMILQAGAEQSYQPFVGINHPI